MIIYSHQNVYLNTLYGPNFETHNIGYYDPTLYLQLHHQVAHQAELELLETENWTIKVFCSMKHL